MMMLSVCGYVSRPTVALIIFEIHTAATSRAHSGVPRSKYGVRSALYFMVDVVCGRRSDAHSWPDFLQYLHIIISWRPILCWVTHERFKS
jgi:hypothetical protein